MEMLTAPSPSTSPSASTAERDQRVMTQLAVLNDLLSQVSTAPDLRTAGQRMTHALREYLSAECVMLATVPRGGRQCELQIGAGDARLQASEEARRQAQAVCQEALLRRSLSMWPPPADRREGLLALKQLVESQDYTEAFVLPLFAEDASPKGAVLIGLTGPSTGIASAELPRFLPVVARPLAGLVHLLQQAERFGWLDRVTQFWHDLRAGKQRTMLLVFAILIAVACVPMRYRVHARVELQPIERRFVAAPFDVALDRAFVHPGDQVSAGQVLARLDAREVAWELAAAEADLARATKERAGFVAEHDSGKARLVQHEMDRLQAKIDLWKHRAAHVELQSPIDGILVTGDFTDAEGVPLETGEILFEIAPLDALAIEIAIPEDEIRFVTPDTPASVELFAFPFQRWDAHISHVTPRAEIREDQQVFIGEARVANPDRELRPGMQGRARIPTVTRPLIWVAFHKTVAAGLAALGW